MSASVKWHEEMSERRKAAMAAGCCLCKKEIGEHQSFDTQWEGNRAKRFAHSECRRSPDTYELRKCLGCAYERRVLVRHDWGEELWVDYCQACDLTQRAISHQLQANEFHRRALAIKAKRAKKKKED